MIASTNGKRKVVDGQFEDPIEVEPKKTLRSTENSLTIVNEPSPEIVRSMHTYFRIAKRQIAPLVETTLPLETTPARLEQAHDPRQEIKVRTCHSHFVPSIPRKQIELRQNCWSPRATQMDSPTHTPSQNERAENVMQNEEWQIPYSHNYHPKIGFITIPTASFPSIDSKDDCLAQSKLRQLDEAFSLTKDIEAQSKNFRSNRLTTSSNIVLEDKDLSFGINDSEITNKDVLCGRGGMTNSHPGNVLFRHLVKQQKLRYGTSQKTEKGEIVRNIIQSIRQEHGRFLKKKDRNLWYEIGDDLAFQKTSQNLREGMAKLYRKGLEMPNNLLPEKSNKQT